MIFNLNALRISSKIPYIHEFNNAQWLEQMNIKLLYFLPPDNYLDTLPRYNDEPDEYYDLLSGHWYESPF